MLIVDPPAGWSSNPATAISTAETGVNDLRGAIGNDDARNAVVYFPRLRMPDPLRENRLADFAPCGAVAGIIARTDAQRGVWKAPAGLEASFSGVQGFTYTMTDGQNGIINPLGLNGLRSFPVAGNLVWGARTLAGADLLASEWKYLPVRRLALFLEESLFRGTQWVVFEPNDEPLWAQIRLNIGAFMQNLFRQGAFQGSKPRDAYFVKCDGETTTQNDIDRGIVNILVGFAPLKPAEFVVIKLQQIAGEIEV
jgi:phage tail sheath protein FI